MATRLAWRCNRPALQIATRVTVRRVRFTILVAMCGCRFVFGIHDPDPITPGDGAFGEGIEIDGPADSSTPGLCVVHTDCASNACLPDGSCADPNDIAWVDELGTSNPTCSRALPCSTISNAINTNKPTIR